MPRRGGGLEDPLHARRVARAHRRLQRRLAEVRVRVVLRACQQNQIQILKIQTSGQIWREYDLGAAACRAVWPKCGCGSFFMLAEDRRLSFKDPSQGITAGRGV
jgi:hypothetical protein